MRRSEYASTLAVIVLAVVGVLALWPRADPSSTPSPSAAPPATSAPSDRARALSTSGPELTGPRVRARLEPCPTPPPGVAGQGPLAGITVPCLGSPGTVDLAAALAGRRALLNVWASWCAPCREEIPHLAAYAAEPGSIPVIGIDVEDRPTAALALLAELGARYPSVTDPDRALWRALRVPNIIPASFVLEPDGSVQPIPPVVFRGPTQIRDTLARLPPPPPAAPR